MQREEHVGEWLPEAIVNRTGKRRVAHRREADESVSMAARPTWALIDRTR
jgi:hypothetical protein